MSASGPSCPLVVLITLSSDKGSEESTYLADSTKSSLLACTKYGSR